MDSTQINFEELNKLIKISSEAIPNDNSFPYLIGLGFIFFAIGIILYGIIWKNNKSELPDSVSWKKSIPYIISFTPSGKPIMPILAGIFTTLGLGYTIGYSIGYLYLSNSLDFIYHSRVIAVSSSIFSVCIALITFWTLNQTKKIDHQQGHKITEFNTLINKLNIELKRIESSFRNEYKYDKQSFHRVYFITNHPFFGTMSYPDKDFTIEFLNNLRTLRDLKRGDAKKQEFEFHILCNDKNAITTYIEDYFSTINPEEIRLEKIAEAVNRFELNIRDYVELNIVERFPNIPDFPQFMIIGNTLFEFIIEAASPSTQIIETQVVTDRKRCEIYIKTFELLRDVLKDAPPQLHHNPIPISAQSDKDESTKIDVEQSK